MEIESLNAQQMHRKIKPDATNMLMGKNSHV